MKKYKVFTAGFPKESEEVFADSPIEAAKKFFIKNQFNNPIVVKWGFLGSQSILLHELKSHFKNIDFDKLEYKKTEDKTSDLDKFMNIYYGVWQDAQSPSGHPRQEFKDEEDKGSDLENK